MLVKDATGRATRNLVADMAAAASVGSSVSLVVVAGPDKGQTLALSTGASSLVIGREPSAALCLHDALTSRVHARVSVSARGEVSWTDASRNGTLLVRAGAAAGTTIREAAGAVPLQVGDALLFGSTGLVLQATGSGRLGAGAPTAEVAAAANEEASAWAAVLSPPRAPLSTPAGQPATAEVGFRVTPGGARAASPTPLRRVRSGSAAAAALYAQMYESDATLPAPGADDVAEARRLALRLAQEDAASATAAAASKITAAAAAAAAAAATPPPLSSPVSPARNPTLRRPSTSGGLLRRAPSGSSEAGMGGMWRPGSSPVLRRPDSGGGLLRVATFGEIDVCEALSSSEARNILAHPFTQLAIARGRAARAAYEARANAGGAGASDVVRSPHSATSPSLAPTPTRSGRAFATPPRDNNGLPQQPNTR